MDLKNQDFEKILKIGIGLSTDRDPNHILETILNSGIQVTGCDAGTVYTYADGKLHFWIMKTLSMGISKGGDGLPIQDMPSVPLKEGNVCAFAAIHREVVNIPDVYHSGRFDFSGPRQYDALTGYRTISMLVVPLADLDGELIGVLQLMNALDETGTVVPFDRQYEIIIRSLGSLAAVELMNLRYVEEIKLQMHSFVEAMATAIDERTPYNGTHTRKVAEYVLLLAKHMNAKYERGECEKYFTDGDIEQLELAALSHDIGKLIIPLSVMNRANRLGGGFDRIRDRFLLLKAWYEIDLLKHEITEEEFKSSIAELDDLLEFIARVDEAEYLPDADYERVQELSKRYYGKSGQERIYYLTEEEREALSVRKGTLTKEARDLMESHAVMTAKILDKVHFGKNYEKIPSWAGDHHEMLDGSGYPQHLKGKEIALETRMITAADIYDALTAEDRPYKKPMSPEAAFAVLRDMAEDGKLDKQVVEWLWEALEN